MKRTRSSQPSGLKRRQNVPSSRAAFTMIELMVVVGVMGLILSMGVPAIYHMMHKEGLSTAVNDVISVCRQARVQAILTGKTAEVVIHPQDGTFDVLGGGANLHAPSAPSEGFRASGAIEYAATAQISDQVHIEMVDVNFVEWKDQPEAHVHFYPNGTCDEFTLVLQGDNNEVRKITLEVVTGLATVQSME